MTEEQKQDLAVTLRNLRATSDRLTKYLQTVERDLHDDDWAELSIAEVNTRLAARAIEDTLNWAQ